MKAGALCLTVLPLAATAACTAEPAPGSPGQAGIIEELRIGVDAGPEELLFGEIQFIAAGHDGAIFVADRQVVTVRMYDAEGEFIKNVGRQGQGPGEFTEINGLKILPDGSLAAWDLRAHRVSIFDASGGYLRSFQADGTRGGAQVFGHDGMGNVYVQATDPDGIDWRSVKLLKYSQYGELLGSVRVPDEQRVPEESFVLMYPSGDLHPFSVATLHALHPLGSLVVGRNDVYDIRIQRSDGPPTQLTRQLQPVPVVAEERAEWEAFVTFLNERSQRAGLRVRDYEPIPDIKPYYRGIYAADDGRIWVLRHVEAVKGEPAMHHGDQNRPPLTWVEPTTFDVFEAEGDFLGSVVLPTNTRALAFRGNRVWGVHTDDDGVERVVQLRVELASL